MNVDFPGRAWKVRIDAEDAATVSEIEDGILSIYYDVENLKIGMMKNDIELIVKSSYLDSSQKKISAHIGQIYTALNEIKSGDYVIVPTRKSSVYYIGIISSVITNKRGNSIIINAVWRRKNVAPSEFQQDLRYSLMAIMKICEVRRNGAAKRLAVIANGAPDPGY